MSSISSGNIANATASIPGIVSTTTQTFGGAKTFTTTTLAGATTATGIVTLQAQPGGTQYRNTNSAGINPNTTAAVVTMTSTDFDQASNFSAGVFTVPTGGAGKYLVCAAANMIAGTALTRVQLGLYKNGSAGYVLSDANVSIGAGLLYTPTGSIVVSLAAADTIQLYVLATGTGNYTLGGASGSYLTYLSVVKVL